MAYRSPAALFALCLMWSAAAMAQESPELIKEHLVDIGGGRHLNMACIGSGAPTVVFELGGLSHLLHWQKIQQPVSALTRACFYERAGFGFSDPAGRAITADNVADDLHTLLHAAGIAGPIVLVGHSLGGVYATHYTDKYESEVAGLVLIDPAFVDMLDPAANPAAAEMAQTYDQETAAFQPCAALAREGKLSQTDPHGCFQVAAGRTPDEIKYLMHQFTRPDMYDSIIAEGGNLSSRAGQPAVDYLEIKQAARSWGDKPVIVLTAGADPDQPKDKGYAAFWKSGHDKLAARSTRGESIVVPNTAHYIQLDQPDQVVAAIRKVVLEVRQSSAH